VNKKFGLVKLKIDLKSPEVSYFRVLHSPLWVGLVRWPRGGV